MPILDFTFLRPATSSAADTAAALERARAAFADTDRQIAAAKAQRDGLLLDGATAKLATAERELLDARANAERTEALVHQLTERLAAAEQRERRERATAGVQAYEEAHAAQARWWKKAGPQLQALFREGHRLERSTAGAAGEMHHAEQAAREIAPDFARPDPQVDRADPVRDWQERAKSWADGTSLDTPATFTAAKSWEVPALEIAQVAWAPGPVVRALEHRRVPPSAGALVPRDIIDNSN